MINTNFFEESKEQSKVKTSIVTKYFDAWARIVMSTQDRNPQRWGDRIAYIDLFAGPGRYADGTRSTPLLILEKAIQDDQLRTRLVTVFNDKDETNTDSLQRAIAGLSNVDTLCYKPEVRTQEVGSEMVKLFETGKMIPTLFFVDPWGYKGLSLHLIDTVVKDWGCDCLFFFNYNRINMGLANDIVEQHMNSLFGQRRAEELRNKVAGLGPEERELSIVEEICQAIKDMGRQYVLPFRFRNESGTRTSHHLIFVSKHFKGYEVMKDVMAAESSTAIEGVPSFEYSPATQRQPLLFSLSLPIQELEDALLTHFAGRTMTMLEIYEAHNVDTRYIKKNYKNALANLADRGQIETAKRRKGTFGDGVFVTFPSATKR